MQSSDLSGATPPESLARPDVAPVRLLIGLLQGILLYWLYRAGQDHGWPATLPLLFVPLLLVALIAPVILGSSLGHMAGRRALLWSGSAAAITAALGVHDAWRNAAAPIAAAAVAGKALQMPSPALVLVLAAGFFIAHSMVMAGVGERRRIASYHAYFEIAWKLAVQLSFSAAFVGALWLVLWLGASLFMLIDLPFLRELLQKPWFSIPISTFAYSWALHITDVRPAIVRGIRSLLLVLMSWVLPVATLIVGGFLASLLFTGLAPLWATRHAASVLLGAAAVLVVMVNAAWQNGAAGSAVAPVIRHSARLAALLLAPIVLIAIYALGLRVADYGWTDDRIIAAACLVAAACYAAGYAFAALRPGWLDRIAGVNIATALLVLAEMLALCSPIADPARLSVNNQLARLASGKVAPDKFDFSYLRFEGVRYGRAALAQLKESAAGKDAALIRKGAETALSLVFRPFRGVTAAARTPPVDLAANITVWPRGTRLPPSFIAANWTRNAGDLPYPDCLERAGAKCDAYLIDLSGDGKPEVLVVGAASGGGAAFMGEDDKGKWRAVSTLPFNIAGCASVRASLIAGRVRAVNPLASTLDVDGLPIRLQPAQFMPVVCPK
jgi:hypothetical protein